jgi:hypothetical protein
MKKQLTVTLKDRRFLCEVTYIIGPAYLGCRHSDDVIYIKNVQVLVIQLFDGTIISRKWFTDQGWDDLVDFLILDEIEWDFERRFLNGSQNE